MTIALQSPVRRKPDDKKKGRYTFTLDKGVFQQLSDLSDATNEPMSRYVERAIREFLERQKPTIPE